MTYEETKQRLDNWCSGADVIISPEVLECCHRAIQKQIPQKVVSDGHDESDFVYCPACNEFLESNEGAYDAFWENNWQPIYCHKCGQAMIWDKNI